MRNTKLLSRLPSIPQYFQQYVDVQVNLEETHNIPCPFHDEKTGKSFSYSKQLGIWRCFGACHAGGDVIALHKLNYKIASYEEAAKSICALYSVAFEEAPDFTKEEVHVDKKDVYRRRVFANACACAKTPDDYVELDYIVSKYPFDTHELELFCSARGRVLSREEEVYNEPDS